MFYVSNESTHQGCLNKNLYRTFLHWEKWGPWLKNQYKDSSAIPKLVSLLLIINFCQNQCFNDNLKDVVFCRRWVYRALINKYVLYNIRCKKCYWKFQQSLWKLSVKDFISH